ncbi:MAG: hypothetical protein A2504_00600 [Bdellovibrionales bacterium RIFOXYD12_FULL_39_22]|nr:MAG: hypothetical protein A2385_03220 [Bdellovibrionales bacterium RIFOXYB1_FULL_39_21]OFZ42661.1 MAG: hypothetical protein A2485_10085 [Bdellovibrionales bacterium RIFOXYC12_FULL_39_17]OFZ47071.1 MAG: hypothetical protein A2404_15210 [Bdellovibrionales bacterium RIFOXYC1_FULL_39_130]OFZ75319.1 MAG: hypothetical protein A2560_13985 [Bdellovibrionales bacterium RIFOXYD1_FULL_39_84]OFZ93270.1 MAG: hypothetical protein A2504_00600 [Bdellovibrionales bacterium RIFOXYD12_FULL_39_22]
MFFVQITQRFILCFLFFTLTAICQKSEAAENSMRQYFRYQDQADGGEKLGYLLEGRAYTLGDCLDIDSFLHLLQNEQARASSIDFDIEQLIVPIPQPRQQIAVALNYEDHQSESHLSKMVFFPKLTKLTTWNTPVVHYGAGRSLLDYEVEWGFLLSRDIDSEEVKKITEDNIINYVAGVFLILDMTSREMQVRYGSLFDSYRGFAASKSLPSYAPVGQFFLRYSDFLKLNLKKNDEFAIALQVNGEQRQGAKLSEIKHMPAELIKMAFERKIMKKKFIMPDGSKVQAFSGKLFKGDIFITGTPAGMRFVAPTSKTKLRALRYGLSIGRPISGARDYIVNHQPEHLNSGDEIFATGTLLGEIIVPIISQ